jgi:hypothetical protein
MLSIPPKRTTTSPLKYIVDKFPLAFYNVDYYALQVLFEPTIYMDLIYFTTFSELIFSLQMNETRQVIITHDR